MPIASAKATSKGQITLPAELRQQLGIKPGDRVDFERTEEGRIELVARTETLEDLKGMLPCKEKPLSNEEIVALVKSVRAEMAEEAARWIEEKREPSASTRMS